MRITARLLVIFSAAAIMVAAYHVLVNLSSAWGMVWFGIAILTFSVAAIITPGRRQS